MDELVGREKDFYIDQLTEQEGRLREEIDEEYETEQQIMCEELAEQQRTQQAEEEFIMADDEEMDPGVEDSDSEYMNSTLNETGTSGTLNVSTNRSGHVCVHKIGDDDSIQTDAAMPDRPKLRVKLRSSTDEIKTMCAKLSSICSLSVEKLRKVVQIVCKELYKHDMYLSATEQLVGEGGVIPQEQVTYRCFCI